MINPYRWPCSALKSEEMAKLTKWRERLGIPITQVVKKAVNEWDKKEEKKWEKKKLKF